MSVSCIACGKATEGEARFCADCRTGVDTSRADAAAAVRSKRISTIWLILVGIAIVGTYAAVLIPALAGKETDSTGILGCLLWTGLFFFLLWKRSDRTPWIGAVIGVAIGFAVTVGSHVIVRVSNTSQLEDELFSAIDRLDPAAAATLRSIRSDKRALQQQLQPLLARAIQTTSDGALLGLVDAQQMMFDPSKPSGLSRCVAAATGTVPSTVRAVSKADEEAVTQAMIGVFQAADLQRAPAEFDMAQIQQILAQAQRDADPTHVLQDPGRFRSLSEQEQCTTYQRVMRSLRSLPSADAAMIFRYMMSARVRGRL